MNKTVTGMLRAGRKIVSKCYREGEPLTPLALHYQGQEASDLIRTMLRAPESCMLARLGATELKTVLRYLNRKDFGLAPAAWHYLSGRRGEFWWDDQIRWEMLHSSGYFPPTDEGLANFAERFLRDIGQIDILGSWLPEESKLRTYLRGAKIVRLEDLEPYYHETPWTTALEGKTVLVIHPFEASIKQQYAKRALLFADNHILPNFTLKTLRAVQSLGGGDCGFTTWFDALDSMCERIRQTSFDVALIGAGAYGLPLAAFVKCLGRKAVHLGGALQILFGIKGKRWDERPFFRDLYNEQWIRPLPEDTPPPPTIGNTKRHFDDGSAYW